MIFVLSFDHTKVSLFLNTHNILDAELLDKIIHTKVTLPSINRDDIDNFLFLGIDEILRSINRGGQ